MKSDLPETKEDFLFLITYWGDSCVGVQHRDDPDIERISKDNLECWEEVEALADDYFRLKNIVQENEK